MNVVLPLQFPAASRYFDSYAPIPEFSPTLIEKSPLILDFLVTSWFIPRPRRFIAPFQIKVLTAEHQPSEEVEKCPIHRQ